MGAQIGFLNCANTFCGIQDGILNVSTSEMIGIQSALLNLANDLDGIEVGAYRACYQETLWHSFFCEGGASWHGRFGHFSISLISFRHREDERNNVELSKAA